MQTFQLISLFFILPAIYIAGVGSASASIEAKNEGLDHLLSYPVAQFRLPVFSSLDFRKEGDRYILTAIGPAKRRHVFEFRLLSGNRYVSTDGKNLQIIDNDTLKTICAADGLRYLFVRYGDGKFRCASIHESDGSTLNLLYSVTDYSLRAVIDSAGRRVAVEPDRKTIEPQALSSASEESSRTGSVRISAITSGRSSFCLKQPITGPIAKLVPDNALNPKYTPGMATSDKILAQIFGGPGAVAAGNGFEPVRLGSSYPLYRGDVIGSDGVLRQGHLSRAIHLYGNADGTADSPIYVPAGFTWHSDKPSSSDAVVLFYYPQLGNLSDVTVAVFHVANFQITSVGNRFRIGNIGGPGGTSASYKHSHIEFYRGRTNLPAVEKRASLRLRPATIFGSDIARASFAP